MLQTCCQEAHECQSLTDRWLQVNEEEEEEEEEEVEQEVEVEEETVLLTHTALKAMEVYTLMCVLMATTRTIRLVPLKHRRREVGIII